MPTPDAAAEIVAVVGDRVGDWLLLERIGAGGMGVVFRARHDRTQREAALKLLTGVRSADAMARMRNEARIMKRLIHPNIAPYLEYVDHRGLPCVAMGFVPGPTLAELLRDQGALSAQHAIAIFRDVVAAVAYLHGQGVIHRDIKPENVKIDIRGANAGRAILLDFGIARDARSAALTATHSIIGTLAVLAPELLDGEPASPRSDVWALGVLLLQMLSGQVPFEASGIAQVRAAQNRGWRANVGARVEILRRSSGPIDRIGHLLDGCLAVGQGKRWADAAEVQAQLEQIVPQQHERADRQPVSFLANTPPHSTHSKPAFEPLAPSRRRLWFVTSAVAAVGVAWFIWPTGPTPIEPSLKPSARVEPSTDARVAGFADVLIDTIGGSAQVYAKGVLIGATPYRVQLRVGSRVDYELRRDGAATTRVEFDVRPIDNRYDIVLRSAS